MGSLGCLAPVDISNIVEKIFQEFAQNGLKPNETILENGKLTVDKVFKILQQYSKYGVARIIIGGSVGKTTAICNGYDFDCAVLVNHEYPLYSKVLDDFEDILTLHAPDDMKVTSIKQTKHSLQFCINGFDIDLLPGTNFILEPHLSGAQVLAIQKARTLEKIQRDPKLAYTYSSSLAASQVEFMKQQSSFVHELVRLCKFWNKTLYIDDYVSGRSTIMELIAVFSGRKQESNSDSTSILRAFRSFLGLVKNICGMNITFEDNSRSYVRPRYDLPMLGEPANPFNNILESLEPKIMKMLSKFAQESIERLDKSCNTLPNHSLLPQIFAPQVEAGWLMKIDDPISSTGCMVGTHSKGEIQKSMIVRKNSLNNFQIRSLQAMVETFVLTSMTAVTNCQNPSLSENTVQETIQEQLKGTIYSKNEKVWSPTTASHDDYDVTFILPYKINNEWKYTKVSFTCKNN